MTVHKGLRVMWLINHTSARKFELPMLKAIGIKEIFQPKSFSNDPSFRSASVDWTEDANLTIPQEDLDILNAADWYGEASKLAWEAANKHFQVVFLILHRGGVLEGAAKYFRGIVLWRAYGLDKSLTYTKVLDALSNGKGSTWIKQLGPRFFFAEAYPHLADQESSVLKSRRLYLPLGLSTTAVADKWKGTDKTVLFVCPDIGFNSYYSAIYKQFTADFKGLPYAIAGAQPIAVNDPHVLGYVPHETHARNMQEMRVMYYHSSEPNHIHYHPFEAIRAGMPLIFMAGGILDRFGGVDLPGRCKTIHEARKKIERILGGDWHFIAHIRSSQLCLLEPMKPENCEAAWHNGFSGIFSAVEKLRAHQSHPPKSKRRIAVIIPLAYRGGSLRGAKLLAQAIDLGARQAGEAVEVVLAHLDDPVYAEDDFSDLNPNIKRRPFQWRLLQQNEAYRAMAYAGLEQPMPEAHYQVPEDGIKQFMDCDLWIMISDRLEHPLLPVRPYVLMVYDYLQRYEAFLPQAFNQVLIRAAHAAEKVLVTTHFTQQDAMQFAGLPSRKLSKVPMLAPVLIADTQAQTHHGSQRHEDTPYFLWTTNLARHKNHENALNALRIYYEQLDGQLTCRVTGVDTREMLKSDLPHLQSSRRIVATSALLKSRLKLLGELSDVSYQQQLEGSIFLWHAGRIDNGTFAVVEAAHLGVPSLSSDYPAMREIDAQFGLNLSWMDAGSPRLMAQQLKFMEAQAQSLRFNLPKAARLATQSVSALAGEYWDVVREVL